MNIITKTRKSRVSVLMRANTNRCVEAESTRTLICALTEMPSGLSSLTNVTNLKTRTHPACFSLSFVLRGTLQKPTELIFCLTRTWTYWNTAWEINNPHTQTRMLTHTWTDTNMAVSFCFKSVLSEVCVSSLTNIKINTKLKLKCGTLAQNMRHGTVNKKAHIWWDTWSPYVD